MRSKTFNRQFRNRKFRDIITIANDPEFSKIIPMFSDAEYRHFATYSMLSHLPEDALADGTQMRYSEFRDAMMEKYGNK